jgi:hypothetical protein
MSRQSKPLPPEVKKDIECWWEHKDKPILKNTAAANALATLFWLGCDPKQILELINGYWTVDDEDRDRRQKPDEFDKRVCKLSRRLAHDAAELGKIGPRMVPSINTLAHKMKEIAQRVDEAYESWLQPDMPRGARVGFLVGAVEMVQIETTRPHYREIADLVSFFRGPTDPATLRINVRNFKGRSELDFVDHKCIRAQWGHKKWDPLRRRLQVEKPS